AGTYTAAKSLLLEDKIGSIEPGKKADILIWNIQRAIQIPYLVADYPIHSVLKNGLPVFTA
ncbi:MAG: amidohydrolase family protein, partial [Candidatus Neomarinimicrobiota bacterium]|nr:amidohydrolase family protein [Candidatus Neomarinimicrobiota bacterium]